MEPEIIEGIAAIFAILAILLYSCCVAASDTDNQTEEYFNIEESEERNEQNGRKTG